MKKLLILLITLSLLIPTISFAQTWELAITKEDQADLKSGHKRMKQGDVIAYKPYPWEWGTAEKKMYFIVIVDGLTEEEAYRLTFPLYEYPDGLYAFGTGGGTLTFGEQIAKRRYNLDVLRLQTAYKGVDFKKLTDPALTYQPFDDISKKMDFKSNAGIYDKYNQTRVFYGTAPLTVQETP